MLALPLTYTTTTQIILEDNFRVAIQEALAVVRQLGLVVDLTFVDYTVRITPSTDEDTEYAAYKNWKVKDEP